MPVFVRHDLANEGHAVEIHRETEPQCPLFAFPGFKRVDFTREFQRVTPRLHHLLRENGEPCPGFSEHRGPHAAVQNSDPEFRLKPRDEAARDRKIKRLRGRGFREPVFRQAESSDQASKLSVFLIFRAFPALRLTLSF